LCAYCPVSRLAREGQHSGVVAIAFVNVVPGSAICLMVLGMNFPRSIVRV
jgi:hypothetical protein